MISNSPRIATVGWSLTATYKYWDSLESYGLTHFVKQKQTKSVTETFWSNFRLTSTRTFPSWPKPSTSPTGRPESRSKLGKLGRFKDAFLNFAIGKL